MHADAMVGIASNILLVNEHTQSTARIMLMPRVTTYWDTKTDYCMPLAHAH